MYSGDIVLVKFEGDNYIKFISHCLANMLISAVAVKLTAQGSGYDHLLMLTVAAPGIDRLDAAITQFNGERLI